MFIGEFKVDSQATVIVLELQNCGFQLLDLGRSGLVDEGGEIGILELLLIGFRVHPFTKSQ